MTVNKTLGSGGMRKYCVESVPDKTRQDKNEAIKKGLLGTTYSEV